MSPTATTNLEVFGGRLRAVRLGPRVFEGSSSDRDEQLPGFSRYSSAFSESLSEIYGLFSRHLLSGYGEEMTTEERTMPFVHHCRVDLVASTAEGTWISGLERFFSKPPDWLLEFSNALTRIERLPKGWDSYNAPSPSRLASSRAREVLRSLASTGLRPSRIAPTAGGGIAIWLNIRDVKWGVEIEVDGSMSVATLHGEEFSELESVLDLSDHLGLDTARGESGGEVGTEAAEDVPLVEAD